MFIIAYTLVKSDVLASGEAAHLVEWRKATGTSSGEGQPEHLSSEHFCSQPLASPPPPFSSAAAANPFSSLSPSVSF